MDQGPDPDIDALLREFSGDEAFVEGLVATFLAQYRDAASEIERACAAGDHAGAELDAHSLKGTAGTLRAVGLQEAARAVHGALRASYYEGLGELLPRLESELGRTLSEFRKWLERRKA